MSKQYSIAEARNDLPGIVHKVEAGKPIQLTRRGKPVAVLLSMAAYERLSRGQPDFWGAVQAFRSRWQLSELDVDEVFAGVRDRSPGREVKW